VSNARLLPNPNYRLGRRGKKKGRRKDSANPGTPGPVAAPFLTSNLAHTPLRVSPKRKREKKGEVRAPGPGSLDATQWHFPLYLATSLLAYMQSLDTTKKRGRERGGRVRAKVRMGKCTCVAFPNYPLAPRGARRKKHLSSAPSSLLSRSWLENPPGSKKGGGKRAVRGKRKTSTCNFRAGSQRGSCLGCRLLPPPPPTVISAFCPRRRTGKKTTIHRTLSCSPCDLAGRSSSVQTFLTFHAPARRKKRNLLATQRRLYLPSFLLRFSNTKKESTSFREHLPPSPNRWGGGGKKKNPPSKQVIGPRRGGGRGKGKKSPVSSHRYPTPPP